MTDHALPAWPHWVYKADGRLVAFEPDRLSLDLFAATESLGQPDPFLARELTDSILHFLALETEGTIPTTAQIAEIAVKVLHELGHPQLAQAFADLCRTEEPEPVPHPDPNASRRLGPTAADIDRRVRTLTMPTHLAWDLGRACLEHYSLQRMYTRDVVAAHAAGLLQLGHLATPFALAGLVLPPPPAGQGYRYLTEALRTARRLAGQHVVIDGPEYFLAETADPAAAAVEFVQTLRLGLEALGLEGIVNLNSATPPPAAGELTAGPLFAPASARPAPAQIATLADTLLERFLTERAPVPALRLHWHLGERDFQDDNRQRLLRVTRRGNGGTALGFVFDRPRRPVLLAEGLDRQGTALLGSVGVHLARLAEQSNLRGQLERFLHKLGSLAHLAVAAGAQRRAFLRKHSPFRTDLTQGFLLDRARLLVVPLGVATALRLLTGPCPHPQAMRQLLQTLNAALHQEGRRRQLETVLDAGASGFPPTTADESELACAEEPFHYLACLPPGARGTLVLPETASAEQRADWLRRAWQQTDLGQLWFVAAPAAAPAPQTLWPER